MSSFLRPHGLQHTRLLCPSLSPGVCLNSWESQGRGAWWATVCGVAQSQPRLKRLSSSRSSMSIESVMLFNHLIFCCPLLSPSVFPSIRIFCKELTLDVRWLQFWSFNICPSSEWSGLISFGIDWFDLLSVQGTLKSLLQHHSSKASILSHSAFFMVQLSRQILT